MRILGAVSAGLLMAGSAGAQSVVQVESGALRGTEADGVEAFKGVPFAEPPIGALRWRAPQPARVWQGVRDATRYGHDCMQRPFPSDAAPLGTTPSEDCLVLNIWRPKGATAKLPVLFWIHGGGFVNGGASPQVYDGTALARLGMVVISANYRLGRFGFFAHPALSAAKEGPVGNWGLMDQQAALGWVQRNIAAFGGDPARVTIMGESAGGASVLHLLGAPAARGLFRGAIIMSGGGRSTLALLTPLPRAQAEAVGTNFAHAAGINGSDGAALDRLRTLPADKVVAGLNLETLIAPPSGPPTWNGPWLDGITVAGTNEQVLETAAQAKVPVMIGATSADLGFVPGDSKGALFAGFGAEADALRAAYDPDGRRDLAALSFAIGGDRMMVEPARNAARQMRRAGQPVYHYRFSYVAEAVRRDSPAGAAHASDIPFFFRTITFKYPKLAAKDQTMSATISRYVANFVLTLDPNGAALPPWPRFDGTSVMDFGADGTARSMADPRSRKLDLVMGGK